MHDDGGISRDDPQQPSTSRACEQGGSGTVTTTIYRAAEDGAGNGTDSSIRSCMQTFGTAIVIMGFIALGLVVILLIVGVVGYDYRLFVSGTIPAVVIVLGTICCHCSRYVGGRGKHKGRTYVPTASVVEENVAPPGGLSPPIPPLTDGTSVAGTSAATAFASADGMIIDHHYDSSLSSSAGSSRSATANQKRERQRQTLTLETLPPSRADDQSSPSVPPQSRSSQFSTAAASSPSESSAKSETTAFPVRPMVTIVEHDAAPASYDAVITKDTKEFAVSIDND